MQRFLTVPASPEFRRSKPMAADDDYPTDVFSVIASVGIFARIDEGEKRTATTNLWDRSWISWGGRLLPQEEIFFCTKPKVEEKWSSSGQKQIAFIDA